MPEPRKHETVDGLSIVLHRYLTTPLFRHGYQGFRDGLRPAAPWYDEKRDDVIRQSPAVMIAINLRAFVILGLDPRIHAGTSEA